MSYNTIIEFLSNKIYFNLRAQALGSRTEVIKALVLYTVARLLVIFDSIILLIFIVFNTAWEVTFTPLQCDITTEYVCL